MIVFREIRVVDGKPWYLWPVCEECGRDILYRPTGDERAVYLSTANSSNIGADRENGCIPRYYACVIVGR